MQGCRSTPPLQLTFGGEDEDGTYVAALDGRYYYAWASSRNGSGDIFLAESLDGENWTRGRPILATPKDDYLQNLVQGPDGIFRLTGGTWGGDTGLHMCESRDTYNWSPVYTLTGMDHPRVTMESGPGASTFRSTHGAGSG